jgi:hypothetical protein
VLLFVCTLLSAAEESHAQASRVLKNGELEIELMDPNSAERYNRGVRFTPVAAVIQASAAKKDFLYGPARHDPLTTAAGLLAEFDLQSPPGFDETKMGEGHLKIGVGVLKKDAREYSFWTQHELLKAAKTEVKWEDNKAEFNQSCGLESNRYAYELKAIVSLKGMELTVVWSLKNTGSEKLETQQYTHNSIHFSDEKIGSSYVLAFPNEFQYKQLDPFSLKFEQRGKELHILDTVEKPGNLSIDTPQNEHGSNELTVRNEKSGQRITCTVSLPCSQVRVHAAPEYLCPEQFVKLSIEPGKSVEWTRTYRFEEK